MSMQSEFGQALLSQDEWREKVRAWRDKLAGTTDMVIEIDVSETIEEMTEALDVDDAILRAFDADCAVSPAAESVNHELANDAEPSS